MYIPKITNFSNYYTCCATKKRDNKKTPVVSIESSPKNLKLESTFYFKGTPIKLPTFNTKQANTNIWEIYEHFKNGSYLDSHDDVYNPENKKIRTDKYKPLLARLTKGNTEDQKISIEF